MVSHYEHGRALPPLAVALSLEIIYRVPVAFLFPAMYDELKRQIRQQEESWPASASGLFSEALTQNPHAILLR